VTGPVQAKSAPRRLGAAACLAAIIPCLCLAPARADMPDGKVFVAAFGEVCIPQRLSFSGTLALAEALGWRPVVAGEDADYDGFIAHSAAMLEEELATDPDFSQGSGVVWFTREIAGRSHLLAVSFLLTAYLDSVGCHLYDFAATQPIDPDPVTRLLGTPIAHSSDGDDPMFAIDPAIVINTVWGPPPGLPRTGDTHLTFVPEGSEVTARIGFTGLMLSFTTSLPDRAEFTDRL